MCYFKNVFRSNERDSFSHLYLVHSEVQLGLSSEHVKQEFEGALLCRGRELQRSLAHLAKRPVLQIVLPPGEVLQVVLYPLVLVEERLVAPQR